jgi:hypothetical protein
MNEQLKPRMSWRVWCELRDDLADMQVSMPEEESIQYYLDDHADTLDALRDICRLTREEFGPQAVLTLTWQPEEGMEKGYLKLLVRLPCYKGDRLIVERFRSIYDAYERAGHFDRSGWVHLTTDFKPVR